MTASCPQVSNTHFLSGLIPKVIVGISPATVHVNAVCETDTVTSGGVVGETGLRIWKKSSLAGGRGKVVELLKPMNRESENDEVL